MRMLAIRIGSGEESESMQRLLEAPIDAKLHRPKLTEFRTNAAGSRIILAALWDLHPRSLLTGEPYDREALAEAILPDGTLKGVAWTILDREPEDHMAMAANRIFVIDEELPEPVDKLLVDPPLHREGDEQAFLTSHALDPELVAILAQNDEIGKIGFLNQRQEKIARIVGNFLSRMAETDHEDTPPLDSLDLDDLDDTAEGRDDRLA